MMKDHIYKKGKTKTDENTWFIKIGDIVGSGGLNPHGTEKEYQYTPFGYFKNSAIYTCYYDTGTVFSQNPQKSCVYGTKDELENWKHFVFNNKLPIFLNICLIIDQNNTSKGFIPWITNKQYTDSEIYKLLNINENEQKLIDSVIKKFERNSTWFKRYMIGSENV